MGNHIDEEKQVVRLMIGIYCNGHHHTIKHALCDECAALYHYAETRLNHCPWGEEKLFCSHCPHHCYQPEKQALIRSVMRYAGPRMLKHRPIMALQHVIRSVRQCKKKEKTSLNLEKKSNT